MDSINRKKIRSALADLREMAIYGGNITICNASACFQFPLIQLLEDHARDLDELKEIKTQNREDVSLEKHQDYFALVLQSNITLKITIKLSKIEKNYIWWALDLSQINEFNRRKEKRETFFDPFWIPVLIILTDRNIDGMARCLDHDSSSVRFEIMPKGKIAKEELNNYNLIFLEDTLPFLQRFFSPRRTKLHIVDDEKIKSFYSVCIKHPEVDILQSERSAVICNGNFVFSIRLFLDNHPIISLDVKYITQMGLCTSLPSHGLRLPKRFIGENVETQLRFIGVTVQNAIFFHGNFFSLGAKIKWYNFLTRFALKIHDNFSDNDASEITKLMLESGNYSKQALQEHVFLHNYLEFQWLSEKSFSKTKYRWLVRNQTGVLIGHCSFLRFSNRLWAAIDNIGSQHYEGSWNKDYVNKYLKIFQEITKSEDSLIHWTYTPSSGVWNSFAEKVNTRMPDSLVAHWKMWGAFFYEYNDIEKKIMTEKIDIIDLSVDDLVKYIHSMPSDIETFIHLLNDGLLENSDFQNDFQHDYHLKLIRYWKKIILGNGQQFLLTYTNYPSWASLNKGHDFSYLFPITYNSFSTIDQEVDIFNLIKEDMFKAGCLPYRLVLVSPELKFNKGKLFEVMVLRAKALELLIEEEG